MGSEKPHILLVEDEIHLARGICYNLELEEYRVSHVESGEEALLMSAARVSPWALPLRHVAT